jgi:hypothetical protein
MNWRNRPPQKTDYETEEEYNEALECYYYALEAMYEERRND